MLENGCTAQDGNVVCDTQLSLDFEWDSGGAGLEVERLGMSDGAAGGTSRNTDPSLRGLFPSSLSSLLVVQ